MKLIRIKTKKTTPSHVTVKSLKTSEKEKRLKHSENKTR